MARSFRTAAPPPILTLLVAAGGRVRREWSPLGRAMLGGRKPEGLAAKPKDPRPADLAAATRILRGEWRFHGESLEVGTGGDPWNRPCPSPRFAARLHGFGWIGDLIAGGEAGTREALRLWLEWRRVFGGFSAFAWTGPPLERRVFNLACAAPALVAIASEAEAAALLASLARQARLLLVQADDPSRALERTCAAALAGSALAGRAGEDLLGRALPRLDRLAPGAVLSDGVHASRSPERGVELLCDLMTLDDALSQCGRPAPVEVSRAMDRLMGAARFFHLGDGRLAAFQGGEAGGRERLAAVLAFDSAGGGPAMSAPHGGYQRLRSEALEVMADTGAPAAGAWSVTACAHLGAIEIVGAGRRLITGCSWSPAAPPSAEPLRLADGASGFVAGERSPAAPLQGLARRTFGPRLVGAPVTVRTERREAPDAVWLDIGHDGWVADLGLVYARRLFLDLAADELRGEDQLTPAGRAGSRRLVPYAVRFHLAPLVRASAAVDGHSVLIRAGTDHGWRLCSDAVDAVVEPSLVFEDGEARRSQQIVLKGHFSARTGGRVRWKLSRDG